MKYFLVILLFLVSSIAKENKTKVDSLQNLILSSVGNERLVHIHNYMLLKGRYDSFKSLYYYPSGKQLAIELNNQKMLAKLHYQAGNAYYYLKSFKKAIQYWDKAIITSEKLKYNSLIANIYTNKASVYQLLRDSLKAEMFYDLGDKMLKQCQNHLGLGTHYASWGNFYAVFNNREKAKLKYFEAINYFNQIKDTNQISYIYFLASKNSFDANKFVESLHFLKEAENLNISDERFKWDILVHYCYLYAQRKDKKAMSDCITKLHQITEKIPGIDKPLEYKRLNIIYNFSFNSNKKPEEFIGMIEKLEENLQKEKLKDIEKLWDQANSEIEIAQEEISSLNKKQNKIIYLYYIISILLLILIFQLLRRLLKKQLTKKIVNQSDQLNQLNKILNGFFEKTTSAIRIVDAKNEILLGNNAHSEMFDLSSSDLNGKNIFQFFKEINFHNSSEIFNYIKNYEAFINQPFDNKYLYTEFSIINKNKDKTYIANTDFKINTNSEILICSISRDITHTKKYEESLIIAKEVAEKSDKLKSEFLAQISHEIRTPVNAMVSLNSLIALEMENSDNQDIIDCVNGIESAGTRLIRTIDLIINMAELQTGTYHFQKQTINLFEEIINPVILEYTPKINSKKLSLIKHEVENLFIEADSYSLYQVIHNLIDNAVNYTEKGTITIDCNENFSDEELLLSIEDTGIGIDQEYLNNIFTPFSQEEQGYTRKYEGNGLGMSLVKRYCDLNDIKIKISSKKNIGTKIELLINK